MPEQIAIIGAGGFGRETLDVVEALLAAGEPLELLGVVDDQPRDIDLRRLANRGVPYLGSTEQWVPTVSGDEHFIVAIGSPVLRKRMATRLRDAGVRATSLIHPRALVGSQARIGAGVVITSGVQVSTNVTLGDHVHLNPGSIVGHDATLEHFVSVNPGAIVSGNVVVQTGTLLGAGSTVLQGLTIGAGSTVGAAACVTKDVAAGATVKGVPAR